MRTRTPRRFAVATLAVALLAGCGPSSGPTTAEEESDTEPMTQQAIAAVALRHLDDLVFSSYSGNEESDSDGNHVLWAALGSSVSEPSLVATLARNARATPAPSTDADPCAGDSLQPEVLSCEVRRVDDHDVVVLSSSSDLTGGNMGTTGVMWVVATRRGDRASVFATQTLTHLEEGWLQGRNLPVSLDQMQAIVLDPLIDARTTPSMIAAGDALEWSGE